MKKVILTFICIIVAFTLSGCLNTISKDNEILDLNSCCIEDTLLVYPDYEFKYSYTYNEDNYIFVIKKIHASFYKKNTITSEEIIADRFAPFLIKITVEGSTSDKLAKKNFYVELVNDYTSQSSTINCAIDSDGEFYGEKILYLYTNKIGTFYFASINSLR